MPFEPSRKCSPRLMSSSLRLKEIGLEVPHLIVAVTPDGEVVLRSNVSPDVLRSFGEDLKNIANELEASPERGDTTH